MATAVPAGSPEAPAAAIVIEPALSVIVMFAPAVSVAFAKVLPVVLPMSNCPFV